MALALDTTLSGTIDNNTTLTINGTISGSNRILEIGIGVYVLDDSGSDVVTGVTWNGVAATRIDTKQQDNIRCYTYQLVAPDTGTHDLVVTTSAASNIRAAGVSYTGAKQSAQPDAHTTNGNTSASSLITSLTSIDDQCWFFSVTINNQGTPTVGAGVTGRYTTSATGIGDSNAPQSPGSYSMTWNSPSAGHIAVCMLSIAPFVPPSTGDPGYSFFM